MKKTLLLLAAVLLTLSLSAPQLIAGGNPMCPPNTVCN